MHASSKKVFRNLAKGCLNTAIVIVCFAFVYFVSCLMLNSIIPRLIVTERTAQQFWVFGAAALMFCGGGFTMVKGTSDLSSVGKWSGVMKAMGYAFEGLVFVGAIVIAIEAVQYGVWVGQHTAITAHSGVDTRYWIASILFADGILGNLLAALLLA